MASSGDGSHQSAAVNAAMKACEHFAGHVAVLVPQLLEVNSKNVALVEGIICQIIEPDMQQTASYLMRVVDKDAKRAQASLHRHNGTLTLASDRLWNCIRELSGTADGSTKLPRSTSKKSRRATPSLPADPATFAPVPYVAAGLGELLHPSDSITDQSSVGSGSQAATAVGQHGAYHPGTFMYPYPFQMSMIATHPAHSRNASIGALHSHALPQSSARSPLSGSNQNSPRQPFGAAPHSSASPMHSQHSPGLSQLRALPHVATQGPVSPSRSDFSKYTMHGMHGGVMYPNTPSATSAHDGTVAGGSHSAPLHQGGAGDDNAHMRAFFMGRVLERRLSSRDRLAANSAAGGVQLDAAEKKAARKLARREARVLARLKRKEDDSFSEIFSNPSLGSGEVSAQGSVYGRLGLMAENASPGMRQVLLAHGSRSWGVHNAPKLGDLSDGLSGDLSGRIEGITDPDLAASLTAAEVAQRTLSQELDRHEQAGTGVSDSLHDSILSSVPCVVAQNSLEEQWHLTVASAASAQEELSHELEMHETHAQQPQQLRQGSTDTQRTDLRGSLRADSSDSTAAAAPRATPPQGLSAEQDALSVELEQQEVAAQQLTHALATERTIPGELPSPSGGSPPWGPAENLERLPTEAVLGQEWADDVQAARAAQEEFTRSIAADAAAVPRSAPALGLERVPTEAVVGRAWAADVHAARSAQDELSRTLAASESVGSCSVPDASDLPSATETAPIASSTLRPPTVAPAPAAGVLESNFQSAGCVGSLEPVPTEAVGGKQWADEVHAVCAAQESLGQTLGTTATPHMSTNDTATTPLSPSAKVAASFAVGNLERAPTEAVVGKQWADEVHAARAAQEALRCSFPGAVASAEDILLTANSLAATSLSPGAESSPPPLDRVPTEAAVGGQWAEEAQAARTAHAALESHFATKGSPPGVYIGDEELIGAPVLLEESAQSIGGVLFDAEIALAVFEQEALSEELDSRGVKSTPNGSKPNSSGMVTEKGSKAVLREPLERVPTEAVMGPDWTSEVRAAAKAQNELQTALSLQPSVTGTQFAEQLAAAEAAQEELSAELTSMPAPGRKQSGVSEGSVAVHWSPKKSRSGAHGANSDSGSAESPFASHGDPELYSKSQLGGAVQSRAGSNSGTRGSSATLFHSQAQDASAAHSGSSAAAVVEGATIWGGFAQYQVGGLAQDGSVLAVTVPKTSTPSAT